MTLQHFIATAGQLSSAPVEELLGTLNDVERKNAPAKLYFRGDKSLFRLSPRVAIVGSRKASPEGLRRAGKLSRALVSQGAVIVSGLAEGIDTAAHEAAIEAGGRTIAVLGTPLERPYPSSNRNFFERIAKEHLVVSQFGANDSVQPKNFPIRNRTMALIAHATVIVEAAEKSGTLHQAWEALRLGRPLLSILESITKNSDLTWPREVQKYGAQILSDATFEGLVEHSSQLLTTSKRLRSEIRFGALLAYSPRGQTDLSRRSRDVCYRIKSGDPETLTLAGRRLKENVAAGGALAAFFSTDVTLVPMPRSAPLVTGALWPAERIAQVILNAELAARVVPALERTTAVPKSSRAAPGERPDVSKHYDSIVAHSRVDVGTRIVVIDDVVTKGTTALAAVSRLAETYPRADISLFAVIRTKGLVPDIEQILDPNVGTIRLNGDEGLREP